MAKLAGSRNKLSMMKWAYDDHFLGRILSMCKLATIVKAIQKNLTKWQLHLFKHNIFGHFLECQSFQFNGVILYNMLLRQVAMGNTRRNINYGFKFVSIWYSYQLKNDAWL